MKRKKLILILYLLQFALFINQVFMLTTLIQTILLQKSLNKEVKRLNVPGIQASIRVKNYYWSSVSGTIDMNKEKEFKTEGTIPGFGSAVFYCLEKNYSIA